MFVLVPAGRLGNVDQRRPPPLKPDCPEDPPQQPRRHLLPHRAPAFVPGIFAGGTFFQEGRRKMCQ